MTNETDAQDLPESLKLDVNDPIIATAVELAAAFVDHCKEHGLMDGLFCGATPDADAMATHYYTAGLDQVTGMVAMIKDNHLKSRADIDAAEQEGLLDANSHS